MKHLIEVWGFSGKWVAECWSCDWHSRRYDTPDKAADAARRHLHKTAVTG